MVDAEGGGLLAFTPLCGDAASPATQVLWKRLERLAYPQQLEAIEADESFHSGALCRRLQTMSLAVLAVSPEVASELANLAVRVSGHVEPGAGDRPGAECDLQALALGYLGAARRVLGELESAGDAFDMARTLRARGTGAPWVEAEILWFEVWLRLEQHRGAAAVTLLDRILAADAAWSATEPRRSRPGIRAAGLAAKAWCFYHRGDVEAAERLLEEAQRLDLSVLPELDLASRFGLRWCAIARGRSPEAEASLAAAATLVARGQTENTAARWLLRRAQARIDVATGRLRAAEQGLREAAAALAQEKQGTEAALAWLALAKLYLQEGGSRARARLKRLPAKLVPAFLPEAGRKQLLALYLFTTASMRGELTVAAVTELACAIEATRQPGLTWWSEWGTVLEEEGRRLASPLAAG